MEYLDYYDEFDIHLGYKTRDEVHKEGLWHKTVHCWLYDIYGNVFFQIRTDSNKFYTTASGHVLKGETVKDAFKREIYEEIGKYLDSQDATLVDIVTWTMDKVKKDGTIMKDRAKANVYVNLYDGDYKDFSFDVNEVLGIVRVKAEDALKLFKGELTNIEALIINDKLEQMNKKVTIDDFLVMEHETALGKYGDILNKVIELTSK